MNERLLSRLTEVRDALSKVEVKGKNNLLNLGGCIAVIEELCNEVALSLSEENNISDKE